jgi:hypothetical protein
MAIYAFVMRLSEGCAFPNTSIRLPQPLAEITWIGDECCEKRIPHEKKLTNAFSRMTLTERQ